MQFVHELDRKISDFQLVPCRHEGLVDAGRNRPVVLRPETALRCFSMNSANRCGLVSLFRLQPLPLLRSALDGLAFLPHENKAPLVHLFRRKCAVKKLYHIPFVRG